MVKDESGSSSGSFRTESNFTRIQNADEEGAKAQLAFKVDRGQLPPHREYDPIANPQAPRGVRTERKAGTGRGRGHRRLTIIILVIIIIIIIFFIIQSSQFLQIGRLEIVALVRADDLVLLPRVPVRLVAVVRALRHPWRPARNSQVRGSTRMDCRHVAQMTTRAPISSAK